MKTTFFHAKAQRRKVYYDHWPFIHMMPEQTAQATNVALTNAKIGARVIVSGEAHKVTNLKIKAPD